MASRIWIILLHDWTNNYITQICSISPYSLHIRKHIFYGNILIWNTARIIWSINTRQQRAWDIRLCREWSRWSAKSLWSISRSVGPQSILWLRVKLKSEQESCGDTEQLTRVRGQIAVHHPSSRDGLEIFNNIHSQIYFSSRLSRSQYLFW